MFAFACGAAIPGVDTKAQTIRTCTSYYSTLYTMPPFLCETPVWNTGLLVTINLHGNGAFSNHMEVAVKYEQCVTHIPYQIPSIVRRHSKIMHIL